MATTLPFRFLLCCLLAAITSVANTSEGGGSVDLQGTYNGVRRGTRA